MLCVDLKNSYYQLPDVHGGLYEPENCIIEEEIDGSTKIETIQEEPIAPNEFFSDLTKQEQLTGGLFYVTDSHFPFDNNIFLQQPWEFITKAKQIYLSNLLSSIYSSSSR